MNTKIDICEHMNLTKFNERVKEQLELDGQPDIKDGDRVLLSQQQLKQIYNYVLSYDCQQLIKSPESLPIRLKKGPITLTDGTAYVLPRTIDIFKKPNGEICLLVETKSKLSDGTKDSKYTKKMKGSYKYGKFAYRIDGHPVKFVSLRQKLDEDLKKEFKISNDVVSPTIAACYRGAEYDKGEKGKLEKQCQIFAEAAECSLKELLEKNINGVISITKEQENKIMLDILHGLQDMHKAGWIHQDIKPDNILIYKDSGGNYSAKITDFGLAVDTEGDKDEKSLATLGYESPEISAAHIRGETKFARYFKDERFSSYAKSVNASIKDIPRESLIDWLRPDCSNDVWAAGMVFNELLYGVSPHVVMSTTAINNKRNIVKDLLNPDRKVRRTVGQAIELLESPGVINSVEQSKKAMTVKYDGVKKTYQGVDDDTKPLEPLNGEIKSKTPTTRK